MLNNCRYFRYFYKDAMLDIEYAIKILKNKWNNENFRDLSNWYHYVVTTERSRLVYCNAIIYLIL